MDVLRRTFTSPAAALLGLLACAGCMLVGALRPGERGLVFSHRLHVEEEGLDCVSCHESAAVEDDPGMPGEDACLVCHEILDEEQPPERRVGTLFGPEGFRALAVSRLDEEVVFSHVRHVEAVEDCGACHRGIEENVAVDAGLAVDMAACERCHAKEGQPGECGDCHSVIDRDWAPPSHARDWTRMHGPVCRRTDPPPIDDCSLCHSQSSCDDCHRVEQPRNHDALFRHRGHAVLASIDRGACATCHEPASCDRCHAEVLPLSHRGGMFGGTRSTHCLSCHFPLTSAGCVTCHKGTPSHALGPPKPDWHTPAMDCRSCHGLSLPLSHVDNGSNCNLCHP